MANYAREFWEMALDTVIQSAIARNVSITPHDAAEQADALLLEWRARWADNGGVRKVTAKKKRNGVVSVSC